VVSVPILSKLYLYPVKSLAGIEVSDWPVNEKGLLYDRKWMLVDREGNFLSQRRIPRMVLIKTRLTPTELILSADHAADIGIPLNSTDGSELMVNIWRDCCVARRVSVEVDQWLSDFLGLPCQLVYQPDQVVRPVDPDYARSSDQVNFSDGFPFLLISQPSLDSLNQVMGLQLPIERFRPNLVISGCDSYAEDYWRQITINQISFRLPKPCSRCPIPTIDTTTAQMSREPLATLNRIRKWNKHVYFGQNALHNNQGQLVVGSTVKIDLLGEKNPPI